MNKMIAIIGILSISSASFGIQCKAVRVQTDKTPVKIELKVNTIFGQNNPGKTELNEADATLPYGLSITTSSSNQDVSISILQKDNLYSSAGASGALDSKGKFQQNIIVNSANSGQDIIDIVCK